MGLIDAVGSWAQVGGAVVGRARSGSGGDLGAHCRLATRRAHYGRSVPRRGARYTYDVLVQLRYPRRGATAYYSIYAERCAGLLGRDRRGITLARRRGRD